MKTVKLSKSFKNKWVKALRSGKYKQGMGELYNPKIETYCCLGVAAIICGSGKQKLKAEGILNSTHNVPKELIGLRTGSVPSKLAMYNDNGKSFKWIASYIERYL